MAKLFGMVMGVSIMLLLLACTPKSAPVPAPTPTGPQATPVASTPAAQALTPEEADWAKVTETAKKEGKLTIYSFAFVGDVAIAIQKAFNGKYGITVDIVSGSGPGFHERLKVERRSGVMVADMVEGSATNNLNMKQDGLTEAYGSLPFLQERGVWLVEPAVDPGKHILYWRPSLQFNWINTKLVNPGEEPRSYQELLAPKWKGKIIVFDPVTIQTVDQWYTVMMQRGILNRDYFIALGKQNIKRAYPAASAPDLLVKGEGHVWIVGSQIVANAYVAQGAPIRPVDAEEGLTSFGNGISLIKGAPNPNSGRLFINWLLSSEGQEVTAKVGYFTSLRKDVPDYSPEGARLQPKKLIVYTPQELEDGAKAFGERQVSKLWGLAAK